MQVLDTQLLRRKILTPTLACLSACLLAASHAAHAQGTQGGASAQGAAAWDTYADTWVATDALGRSLPGDAPAPRANKTVGMFYFLWHGQHGTPGPFDISKLIATNPEAPKYGGPGAFHWWGEPEAGYFRADDPWVIRRNLSMLRDAGVDVLFFDVTNAAAYLSQVKAHCEQSRAMAALGQEPPKVAFITHSHPAETQQKLYDEFYAKGLYPELWYRWAGKPLLLGVRDAKFRDGREQSAAVRDFFTWRYSWAWDAGPGKWQWIDKFPQKPGLSEKGQVEQMPVAVASHPTSNIGRSFHAGQQPPIDKYALTPTYAQGLHFEEQWQQALKVDPAFVFVDGWNEWVAQRFVAPEKGGPGFLGKPTQPGGTWFVDAYNAEFNRDIEPMKGGSSDSVYYQLIANVRRYKGARKVPLASAARTMKIDGQFDDWKPVGPEFRDTRGDTLHRDFAGWGALKYLNATGRNDIVAAKVARDSKYLYFTARTESPLTGTPGDRWMVLFIDTDQDARTGWHGYELRIGQSGTNGRTEIERWDGMGWKAAGLSTIGWQGRQLELALPRELAAQKPGRVAIDFKWVDGADPDSLESWFTDGDAAPNRRFNFRYQSSAR